MCVADVTWSDLRSLTLLDRDKEIERQEGRKDQEEQRERLRQTVTIQLFIDQTLANSPRQYGNTKAHSHKNAYVYTPKQTPRWD